MTEDAKSEEDMKIEVHLSGRGTLCLWFITEQKLLITLILISCPLSPTPPHPHCTASQMSGFEVQSTLSSLWTVKTMLMWWCLPSPCYLI